MRRIIDSSYATFNPIAMHFVLDSLNSNLIVLATDAGTRNAFISAPIYLPNNSMRMLDVVFFTQILD